MHNLPCCSTFFFQLQTIDQNHSFESSIIDILYGAAKDILVCHPSVHLEVVPVEEEEGDTPHHSSSCQGKGVTNTQVVEGRELDCGINDNIIPGKLFSTNYQGCILSVMPS